MDNIEVTEKLKELKESANSEVSEKIMEIESRISKLEEKNSNLSIVLLSGEFDKAMAAFIIANGALSMGKDVSIFITFWGLDVIKKPSFSTTGRHFLEKMIIWMRPNGPNKLPTSKMNFGGIGPKLFRYMMSRKNVIHLQPLIDMARELGIKIIACQMSMDVMGLKKEDFIDGIEVGGVAAFLSVSYKSNTTLFI